jgi:hypothetical protein
MSILKIGLAVYLFVVQSVLSKPGMDVLGFDLNEGPSEVRARLGQPDNIDDSLPKYTSWLFKLDAQDEGSFGYIFCFRRSDHKLISVTRNFEPAVLVDDFFPKGSSTTNHWPSDEKPQFGSRVRTLPGKRLLLGMGCDQEGKPCSQLIVIDRNVVPIFFPWLKLSSD